jgi:ParB/RepB/Spo0J family partition protein
MDIRKDKGALKDIPVDKIDRNPENPRLFFRQDELDELTESIRRHGVQVPISVYREAGRYVLIDGERRWRSSLKLNRRTIPAIVQTKPDPLTNLILMFNIHALREQWDLLTIAIKLPRVIHLFQEDRGTQPNERELSEQTGLARGTIRRCRLLMALPQRHIDVILTELKKPKLEQRITEDFYIEMERALKTVGNRMPELIQTEEKRDEIRIVLLKKYRDGLIRSVTDFRQLGACRETHLHP